MAGESWSGRLNALDTVIRDTPTCAATVARVGSLWVLVAMVCTGKDFTGTEALPSSHDGGGSPGSLTS